MSYLGSKAVLLVNKYLFGAIAAYNEDIWRLNYVLTSAKMYSYTRHKPLGFVINWSLILSTKIKFHFKKRSDHQFVSWELCSSRCPTVTTPLGLPSFQCFHLNNWMDEHINDSYIIFDSIFNSNFVESKNDSFEKYRISELINRYILYLGKVGCQQY